MFVFFCTLVAHFLLQVKLVKLEILLKIVDLERWSTLRDSRTKTIKVEKDMSTMFRKATVFEEIEQKL